MKGMCRKWQRGRYFPPSLPGHRFLKLGPKSDCWAEISGDIVRYDALVPRPKVLRPFSSFYANNVVWVSYFLVLIYSTTLKKKKNSHFRHFSKFSYHLSYIYLVFVGGLCQEMYPIRYVPISISVTD